MDKFQLVITEIFTSGTDIQRKENLEKAMDQYILLKLKNGGPPTGTDAQKSVK